MGFFDLNNISRERNGDSPIKRRILIMTCSNLALQLIWFFYRMMLTRCAGTETLGLNSLVMQVYSLIVSVAISGLNVAVTAQGAKTASHGEDPAALKRLLGNGVKLFLMLYFSITLPVFLLRNEIAEHLIGEKGTGTALVFMLISIFMTGIENVLKSIHIAIGRVGRTAISELSEQSLRMLIVWLLLKNSTSNGPPLRTALIMAGMFLSEFFSVGFLMASFANICRKNTDNCYVSKNFTPECDPVCVGSLIKVLVPAALTGFASTVFASAAALILPTRLLLAGYTRQAALSSIGVLNAAAIPLVSLPMAFVGAVAALLMPAVSSAYQNGSTAYIRKLASKSMGCALVTAVFVNAPALLFLAPAAQALFGMRPTLLCFLLLTLKQCIIYYQVITSALLNGLMKQKKVLLFTVIGETIQLVLILIMCSDKNMHIYGYLAAMCIGEGVRLAISMIYTKRLIASISSADAVCRREAAVRHSR